MKKPLFLVLAFCYMAQQGCRPKECAEIPDVAYHGVETHFYDCSEHARSHLWDFGDGHKSEAPDPVHVYNSPGTFKVWHTVESRGKNSGEAYKLEVYGAYASKVECTGVNEYTGTLNPDFYKTMLYLGDLEYAYMMKRSAGGMHPSTRYYDVQNGGIYVRYIPAFYPVGPRPDFYILIGWTNTLTGTPIVSILRPLQEIHPYKQQAYHNVEFTDYRISMYFDIEFAIHTAYTPYEW